ncbi:MAG: acyl-CoA dehydratase activase [Butyrivibrio sp.]|nr:acyl-CoA dehydratase activase [Acetatifactor muris]MCM1559368.1 acyl-CoA dehydratase activase [Butyrivibrio sp.]
MYRIGIDVGSTRTKYAVVREDGTIDICYSEKTPVRQKEYFGRKVREICSEYGNCSIVSCGYGKANIPSVKQVNELRSLALGAYSICREDAYVLDIGGQDTKLIVEQQGKLREFFLNDKCAAGCGQFLANVLNLLEMDFDSLDMEGLREPEKKLSSVCAVFAQTEIVGLIAEGIPERDIIWGVIWQILVQAKKLTGKTACNKVVLSGGLSQIQGIGGMAESALGMKVAVPEHSAYLSAIGCALA